MLTPTTGQGPFSIFRGRFKPVVLLVLLVLLISFLTRIAILLSAASGSHWSFRDMAGSISIGLFYDLMVSTYLIVPFVLQIWFSNENMYRPHWKWKIIGLFLVVIALLLFTHIFPKDYNSDLYHGVIIYLFLRLLIFAFLGTQSPAFRNKWRVVVLNVAFFVAVFLLLFNAVSEWIFWNEFATRYNFIAVDYMVYTNEVIGNITQSYPVFWIIGAVLVVTAAIFLLIRKILSQSVYSPSRFFYRTKVTLVLLLLPILTSLLVTDKWKKFSDNNYASELAANGIFEFAAAFRNNELDFYRFYKTLPDAEAFQIVREQLKNPSARFSGTDSLSIDRDISAAGPRKNWNVVLISVESLSADFMGSFGNRNNLTPNLDSLAGEGLLFTNLYASGTRTVRGLEALSLATPPTPGESIIKRPDNEHLFSLGSVFQKLGYQSQFMYGGYGYFDNMNEFFSNNGYQVIDRTALSPTDIHYANIWGVADEDLFTLAITNLDRDHAAHNPFFAHIMTVSNHRPYTYPEGRIDISPKTKTREGAVKYTDYAIGKFIREAKQKPWFKNTIFVIVADHCAHSAGRVEMPVNNYHIPLIIYSPAHISAQKVPLLSSQIDIPPTILGLLHVSYRSEFMGQDIFSTDSTRGRGFISTYQGLGYLKDSTLVIQSPVRQVKTYAITNGKDAQSVKNADSLTRVATAYYQVAAWLFKHRK